MPAPTAVVLVHVTSLPGAAPVGELGELAQAFLRLCRQAGLDGWQMLPVGPCGAGNSPYSALSSFAGHPLLISPGPLVAAGLLKTCEIPPPPAAAARVDYDAVTSWKREWVERAWSRFRTNPPARCRVDHARWREGPAANWIEEWRLFAALRVEHGRRPWFEWPVAVRHRQRAALRAARERLAAAMQFHEFVQFLFGAQWNDLRAAAAAAGVRLIGDLPFYPAHDSADTWGRPDLFSMDPGGKILQSAGVPPDYFSADGQLWGTPTFRWNRLREEGYAWWSDRLAAQLARFDVVRLDHFRGYAAYWAVDGTPADARGGRWLPGPGAAPFATLADADGRLIAEDLGEIDEPVHDLRRRLDLPGMVVFQFLQGDTPAGKPLPDLPRKTVLYTATHDNDTTRGWIDSLAATERDELLARIGTSRERAVERIVEICLQAEVETVVIPLQDWLDLPAGARMNRPGVAAGNWEWRCVAMPSRADVKRLRGVLATANRGRRPDGAGPG